MAKLKLVGLWLLQILLAFLFFNIGRQKFTNPVWVRSFREWGYPEHFYAVVGAVELLGSLLLLVPRIASYAAGAVILVMLGALGHHVARRMAARHQPAGVHRLAQHRRIRAPAAISTPRPTRACSHRAAGIALHSPATCRSPAFTAPRRASVHWPSGSAWLVPPAVSAPSLPTRAAAPPAAFPARRVAWCSVAAALSLPRCPSGP